MSANKKYQTFLQAFQGLQGSVERGKKRPEVIPVRLTLNQIKLHPEVFQHRRPPKHISEIHIKELAKTPKDGRDLDPITVWWGGVKWVCIDGHHRYAACRQAREVDDVPVDVFTGTLEEALARAAEGNTHDKLAMGKGEKAGAAWRLTVSTTLSKAKVVAATGTSDRAVANMRAVKLKLLKKDPDADLSELSWMEARAEALGKTLKEVDWDKEMEKEAQKFAERLAKVFGTRPYQRRESFARALEIYDGQLPAFLREFWQEEPEDDLEGA